MCEDIAIKFGTVGYMKSLKRIQVGDFKIEDSITIDELNNIIQKNELDKTKTIITLEKLFEKIPSIRLDGVMLTQKQNEGVYKIYNQKDEFIGTGTIKDNLLKRDIIL